MSGVISYHISDYTFFLNFHFFMKEYYMYLYLIFSCITFKSEQEHTFYVSIHDEIKASFKI